MLQSASIPDAFKVRELLDLTRSYYPTPRSVADCIALAGLEGLLERRYGRLSGGQQRRVQFALALCGRPRLLFLDEPTTGLDIEARQGLWRAIRELVAQGCAVLLTTHYLEEAEALADRVVVLHAGRVAAQGSVQRDPRARLATPHPLRVVVVGRTAWRRGRRCAARNAIGDRIEIVSDVAEAVVRRLLAEDAGLQELEVQRAGLAEAFLELTQGADDKTALQEAA